MTVGTNRTLGRRYGGDRPKVSVSLNFSYRSIHHVFTVSRRVRSNQQNFAKGSSRFHEAAVKWGFRKLASQSGPATGATVDVRCSMHRKKPRKPPTSLPAILQRPPLSRRLPAPPASGLSRIVAIVAVYTACIIVISIVVGMTAAGIFWLIGGSPIRSGPGFVIYALGMIVFLWPMLYLVGELDCWRKRGRAVSDKRP